MKVKLFTEVAKTVEVDREMTLTLPSPVVKIVVTKITNDFVVADICDHHKLA